MAGPAQERRTFPRQRVTLTAHARIGHRFVKDAVADLSGGGLYLHTTEPARVGSPVSVAIVLPSRAGPDICTLQGAISRVDRDATGRTRGVAVRFTREQISAADRAALDRYLGRADARA